MRLHAAITPKKLSSSYEGLQAEVTNTQHTTAEIFKGKLKNKNCEF
jgi:hypothetical protein